MTVSRLPPILTGKSSGEPSVFTADNLLREARRQKRLPTATVPAVCVLDPDGDIVRHLVAIQKATRDPDWACYHTDLWRATIEGLEIGIVGCAVGASFAVLVAEQMFASGCGLLLSVTSAGRLVERRPPPYFVLIDRALRDEGTSYHYLPPSEFSTPDAGLIELAAAALTPVDVQIERGGCWTTDAPFRETASQIAAMTEKGLLAVEMEAAALYAFAAARQKPVICFAHVTNQMAQIEGDFEKGAAGGATVSLIVIAAVGRAWCRSIGFGCQAAEPDRAIESTSK
jgi:uridine phosphorylase